MIAKRFCVFQDVLDDPALHEHTRKGFLSQLCLRRGTRSRSFPGSTGQLIRNLRRFEVTNKNILTKYFVHNFVFYDEYIHTLMGKESKELHFHVKFHKRSVHFAHVAVRIGHECQQLALGCPLPVHWETLDFYGLVVLICPFRGP